MVSLSFAYTKLFQSTLPRRERRLVGWFLAITRHFNPRSREGSDDFIDFNYKEIADDFNPRSREGSDKGKILHYLYFVHFNPRSREGSDMSEEKYFPYMGISIHAPAKGATFVNAGAAEALKFQSTLPRRERLLILSSTPFMARFQSTLPRRERRRSKPNISLRN